MTVRSAVAAALALTLLVGACAGEEPPAPTTTTGTALPPRVTRPTVPPSTVPGGSTTTTVPAEIATDVNACELLEPDELGGFAGDDPGPGTLIETIDTDGDESDGPQDETDDGPDMSERPSTTGEVAATTVPEADIPTVLLSSCSWPTDGPPAITLTYLYPTTSRSAREHLQRVIDLGTRFGEGARVFPLAPVGSIAPAALQTADGTISEVAAVTGSALLYVVPAERPLAASAEATALVAVTVAAARKAPG